MAKKPSTRKRSKGRPPFSPTDHDRERVQTLIAGGLSEDDIASVVGVSRNTLRKSFGKELGAGRAKRRAAIVEHLYEAATSGSVAAMRQFLTLLDQGSDLPAERRLGKKERQQRDAEQVGGILCTPPPPRIVVDNER